MSGAFAHGGGLDKQGGHLNRKTGEYHCHRSPCFQVHEQVKQSQDEAERNTYSTLYDRDDWKHWIDADRDCQDTRAEILIRDSTDSVRFRRSRSCSVASGMWPFPYYGGSTESARDLDIDHVVPLKWAHGHGGDQWSPNRKMIFANDRLNLLSVSASANRSKGSRGPDQWMPRVNHCLYAKIWLKVIEKYDLQILSSERIVLINACE